MRTNMAMLLAISLLCTGFAGCVGGAASEVCQDALDHAAACHGVEPRVFVGECDGAVAGSAREVLSLDCSDLEDGRADGFACPEILAELGLCGGPVATLGPWGLRITEIVATRDECRREGRDLIEPGLELRRARTVERCLETSAFRPVIDIDALETYAAAGVPYPSEERAAMLVPHGLADVTDSLVLGNVGHLDGRFAVARVPLAAFEGAEAYYLIETFEVSAIRGSHGMVRVRFDAPVVELYEQHPPSAAPMATTRELVLSVHATAVRGGSYDPLSAGLHDGMALARGVFSIENKVQDVLLRQGHTVEQYLLSMTGEDIRRYVIAYAAGSPDRIFEVSYHTFRRNCGTEILQVFRDAFPERGYPPPESLDNTPFFEVLADAVSGRLLPDIVPERVRPALESRGLFEAEVEPWSTDPTIQEVVESLGW